MESLVEFIQERPSTVDTGCRVLSVAQELLSRGEHLQAAFIAGHVSHTSLFAWLHSTSLTPALVECDGYGQELLLIEGRPGTPVRLAAYSRSNSCLIFVAIHWRLCSRCASLLANTIPCADEPAWTTGGRSERIGSVRKVNTGGHFGSLPEVSESSLGVLAVLLCVSMSACCCLIGAVLTSFRHVWSGRRSHQERQTYNRRDSGMASVMTACWRHCAQYMLI